MSVSTGRDEDQCPQPDQAGAADGAGRTTGGPCETAERVSVHRPL